MVGRAENKSGVDPFELSPPAETYPFLPVESLGSSRSTGAFDGAIATGVLIALAYGCGRKHKAKV